MAKHLKQRQAFWIIVTVVGGVEGLTNVWGKVMIKEKYKVPKKVVSRH